MDELKKTAFERGFEKAAFGGAAIRSLSATGKKAVKGTVSSVKGMFPTNTPLAQATAELTEKAKRASRAAEYAAAGVGSHR